MAGLRDSCRLLTSSDILRRLRLKLKRRRRRSINILNSNSINTTINSASMELTGAKMDECELLMFADWRCV